MSRIANEKGRLKVILPDGSADVERASNGVFSSNPQAVYERWDEFQKWLHTTKLSADSERAVGKDVGSPVPLPRQIVGIGINYHSHITMSGLQTPTAPPLFIRLLTSMTGPYGDVPIYNEAVFTEVEVAVVLKRAAYRVPEEKALDYIAGITIAQDMIDPTAVVLVKDLDGKLNGRFNNGAKSFPGFAPIGPDLVSLDEIGDLGSLDLECDIDGKPFQRGNTSDMSFGIPELIARITSTMHLLAGDLILTGTPGRVKGAEHIRLHVGNVITARVQSLGEQRNQVIDGHLDQGVYL
jgi:2-keto-4-pentenoate hydratase/2-oxohepta-3-ene-1,7-dioic acid hydratase in catechol pathway